MLKKASYISYLQGKKSNKGDVKDELDISLRLPNNTTYAEKGEIVFADTKIEQGMGTVELRAIFQNPDDIILPGLFVTLVAESKDKKAWR